MRGCDAASCTFGPDNKEDRCDCVKTLHSDYESGSRDPAKFEVEPCSTLARLCDLSGTTADHRQARNLLAFP